MRKSPNKPHSFLRKKGLFFPKNSEICNMNNSIKETKPYVGLTEYNYQEPDYRDGDLTIINHLRHHPRMHPTQMDMVFVAICIEGEFTFDMDGHECTIGKDDIFIGHPNAIYENFVMSKDLDCKLLCITKSLLMSMLYPNQPLWNKSLFLDKHNLLHLSPIDTTLRGHLFALLEFNMQESTGAFQKETIHAIIRVLLYGISRALTQQIKLESSHETNQRKILFDNFITLLSSNEIKKKPLAYYSDKLCVSSRYLTMVCRDVSKKTAYDWISEYVQNDVRYYLLHSNLTIKEIAVKLGFCNLSFFGKYVRENFGVSPSEYRKQYKDK